MFIGHINLAPKMNGSEGQLILLVEALATHGVSQHAVVRNRPLACRLLASGVISVGPSARTAVTASCLMPDVDIVHVHDARSLPAGLILTLTRAIPYLVTYRSPSTPASNPLSRSMYRRAKSIVCRDEQQVKPMQRYSPGTPVSFVPEAVEIELSGERPGPAALASAYLRIYRSVLDGSRVSGLSNRNRSARRRSRA